MLAVTKHGNMYFNRIMKHYMVATRLKSIKSPSTFLLIHQLCYVAQTHTALSCPLTVIHITYPKQHGSESIVASIQREMINNGKAQANLGPNKQLMNHVSW